MRLPRLLTAVLLSLSYLLLLPGCIDHSPVESFTLISDNPGNVALREDPGVRPEREGTLLPGSKFDDGMPSTPEYRPLGTAKAREGETLYLTYRSEIPTRVHIGYGEGRQPAVYDLPVTNGELAEASIPVEIGTALASLRVSSAAGDAEAGDPGLFALEELHISEGMTGAVHGDEGVRFSLGTEGWRSLGFGGAVVRFASHEPSGNRGEAGRRLFSQRRVKIVYTYIPSEEGKRQDEVRTVSMIDVSSGRGESERFELDLHRGNNTVYLYSRSLGFDPQTVEISPPSLVPSPGDAAEAADSADAAPVAAGSADAAEAAASAEAVEAASPGAGAFSVRAVELQEVPMYASDSPEPLPADVGTVLRYSRQHWRRSDWELFSWSIFPSMLVFDFSTYELQARFLKRLAFYVEKDGYRGRLHPNGVIGGLHGWNAHDYRAEDLAEFFTLAEKENFPLNREEELLAEILVDNNIIDRRADGYEPVGGGLISLSQESSERLRDLFMTHEGAHALYFVSPAYREEIGRIWDALSERERWFWREFLDWRTYDVADSYLLENEFQAYLMQQPVSQAEAYFHGYIIPRFLTFFPGQREEMEEFQRLHPEHFVENARRVAAAAERTAGVTAGNLATLQPTE